MARIMKVGLQCLESWHTVTFKSKLLSQDTNPSGSSPGPTPLCSPHLAQSQTPPTPWLCPLLDPAQAMTLPSPWIYPIPDPAQSMTPSTPWLHPILDPAQSMTPPTPWLHPVPDSASLLSCLWVPKYLDVSSFSAFAHVVASALNSHPPNPTLSIISAPIVMKTQLRHFLGKPSLTTPHPELMASSSVLLCILFEPALLLFTFFLHFLLYLFTQIREQLEGSDWGLFMSFPSVPGIASDTRICEPI